MMNEMGGNPGAGGGFGGLPGGGGGGGAGGFGGFPAPGLTGMTPPAPAAPGSPTSAAPGAAPTPGANPMFDPAMMQQMMSAFGGGSPGAAGANPFGGANPFAALGGAPVAPADSRPPEERFQVQLQVSLHPKFPTCFSFWYNFSNCKTWVSATRLRMCELCWLRLVTCIRR